MRRLSTNRIDGSRGGWTLVEVLVGVSILTVLFGTVALSGRMVQNSRRKAAGQGQLRMIATAIDQYSDFWPSWKVGSIVIADKGWPDFVPGRLLAACPNGVYQDISGYNDVVDLGDPDWIENSVLVLNANTTLAFALLASSGKGPFIKDRRGASMQEGDKFASGLGRVLYPPFDTACVPGAANIARTTEVFVDPWGTPIRYFWVYRDASRTAHRGYLPVDFGPFLLDSGPFGVLNGAFNQPAAPTATQVSAGYVLESAGPDKKFGNVWKINPTEQEIADAEDNPLVAP